MAPPFHPGELAVQARAGVQHMARRIGRGIGSSLPPAARDFLHVQTLAVAGSIDPNGRVWASPLTGPPGFIRTLDDRTVRIDPTPRTGDPLLDNLRATGQLGIVAI